MYTHAHTHTEQTQETTAHQVSKLRWRLRLSKLMNKRWNLNDCRCFAPFTCCVCLSAVSGLWAEQDKGGVFRKHVRLINQAFITSQRNKTQCRFILKWRLKTKEDCVIVSAVWRILADLQKEQEQCLPTHVFCLQLFAGASWFKKF